MYTHEITITEFIIEEQRKIPGATGGFSALLNDIGLGCKRIANVVGKGSLAEQSSRVREVAQKTLIRTTEWGGHLAAMAFRGSEDIFQIPPAYPRGDYLLTFDPLCGVMGLEVNAVAGSIFSVLRAPETEEFDARSFFQAGKRQLCAGYAIYGPTTMLVLALENGVYGFTLDRDTGEFILTHHAMQLPETEPNELSINTSGARFWEPAVKRYVDECLAGHDGPRGRDFGVRWASSLVADAHLVLMHGGVFLHPGDSREEHRQGRHELLFEANPIGYVIERAGGRASTGDRGVLDVAPEQLHQKTPFIFGSRFEVERLEQYFRDTAKRDFDSPLFGSRGLLRPTDDA